MSDKKDLLKLEHIHKWYKCGENVTKAINEKDIAQFRRENLGFIF
jgi:hypothetical protein